MNDNTVDGVRATVDAIYRAESRRVLATLIRLLGSFDLAEEALHDAFIAAVEQWQRDGVPDNPRAWLVSAGRFKAIDKIRRRARFDASLAEFANELDADAEIAPEPEQEGVEDDRLRLIQTTSVVSQIFLQERHPGARPGSRRKAVARSAPIHPVAERPT